MSGIDFSMIFRKFPREEIDKSTKHRFLKKFVKVLNKSLQKAVGHRFLNDFPKVSEGGN